MELTSVSVVSVVVAIVISYGLGMVPGASIVARRHGVDLRAVGDGNPGAWNALDQLGWRRAWPAFAIDGAKGLLAAAVGWGASYGWVEHLLTADEPRRIYEYAFDSIDWQGFLGLGAWPYWPGGPDVWLPWACLGAAMLGHAFPLAHPTRGGKSVMTFAGGAIGLVPVVGVPLALVFIIAVLTRRAALGARIVVFAFPIAQAAAAPLIQVAWTGGLMTLIGLLFLLRRGDRRRRA